MAHLQLLLVSNQTMPLFEPEIPLVIWFLCSVLCALLLWWVVVGRLFFAVLDCVDMSVSSVLMVTPVWYSLLCFSRCDVLAVSCSLSRAFCLFQPMSCKSLRGVHFWTMSFPWSWVIINIYLLKCLASSPRGIGKRTVNRYNRNTFSLRSGMEHARKKETQQHISTVHFQHKDKTQSIQNSSSGDVYSVTHAFRQTTGNKADGGQWNGLASVL